MIQPGFLFSSAVLGAGLAMDAFSVSMANGLRDPDMGRRGRLRIAVTFALFQCLMPMLGWTCVRTVLALFSAMRRHVPWIAAGVLAIVGGNMVREGLAGRAGEESAGIGWGALALQGVATSIDALSAGFTIAEYGACDALAASLIISAVTFWMCLAGVSLGRRFGTRFSGKADALGGAILIAVGLKIFLQGIAGG